MEFNKFLMLVGFLSFQALSSASQKQLELLQAIAARCPSLFETNKHWELPTDFKGGVPARWGQEQVGLPETWALANTMLRSGAVTKFSSIAVNESSSNLQNFPKLRTHGPFVENSFHQSRFKKIESDAHQELVAHVAAGESITGAAPLAKISIMTDHRESMPDWLSPESSYFPRVVNMSHGPFVYSEDRMQRYVEYVNKFSKTSIIVRSIGNDFPHVIPPKMHEVDAIHVGASDPDGRPTEYSDESKLVDISAPSGILSINQYGDRLQVDGTSFAAPLVAGSLANVITILEYNSRSKAQVTKEEARALLRKSSIKTSEHSDERQMNGVGILNSYKLLRLALRLQDEWPKNRKRILDDPSLYDFSQEASTYKAHALKMIGDKTPCGDFEQILKNLRLAFFLNSEDEEVRTLLAGIYESYGRWNEAQFYGPPKTGELLHSSRKWKSGIVYGNVQWVKEAEAADVVLNNIGLFSSVSHRAYWQAIRYGNLDVVKHLHSKGARILQEDAFGLSFDAINSCSRLGSNNVIKILRFLRESQPKEFEMALKKSEIVTNVIRLKEEECSNRKNIVIWLALAGADLNAKRDASSNNPMQQAYEMRDEEMKRLLTDLGAKPVITFGF